MTPAHDINRLPKWARELIRNQERHAAQLRRQLAEGSEGVRCFGNPYVDVPQAIPSEHVEFRFNEDAAERYPTNITIKRSKDYYQGECIEIMGTSSLAVMPSSSNVVRIKVLDR